MSTTPSRTPTAPTRRVRPRLRRPLRLLVLWVAVLASLLGVGSATAAAPAATATPAAVTASAAQPALSAPWPRTLTGVWDLTVTVGTGSDAAVTTPRFFFHADHRLTAEGPPDSSGEPEYLATGFWNAQRDGSFVFYVTHPGGPDANHPGTIQGVHMGRITGRWFTTGAVAFAVDDATGHVDGPITVRSRGTWVRPLP